MFRAFWILLVVVTISASPARAERADSGDRWTNIIERPRRDRTDYQDTIERGSRERQGRGHSRQTKRPLYSGPGVIMLPGRAPMGQAQFVPGAPQMRLNAMAAPIAPPPQFSYYCNNPPGFYPAVAACPGRWLEMGARH